MFHSIRLWALPLALIAVSLPSQDLPSSKAIVDLVLAGRGDKDALAQCQSAHSTGSISFPAMGLEGSLEIWMAKGNKLYSKVDIPGIGVIESGCDGEVMWEKSAIMGERIVEGQERALKERGSPDALLKWGTFFKSIEATEEEEIRGHACYKVKAMPKQGDVEWYWVEKETGAIWRSQASVESPMGKQAVQADILEYGEVDGVRLAKKTIQTASGQKIELGIDKHEVNVAIPEGRFALPDSIQALVDKQQGGKTFLCVSAAKDKKLLLYELDGETGQLTEKEQIELDGGPGCQCISPDGKFLYVAIRNNNSVATYAINAQAGTLERVASTSIGANPAYIATDRTGRTLLWASYRDGLVGSHRIGEDGAVVEGPVSRIETHRCAHAILADAENRYVLVPHTCANAVYQFRFDAATGALAPNDPPLVQTAQGLEPRHLAFHPNLPIVYFDDEKGDSVTAYRYSASEGTVKAFQTVSTLPADFDGSENTCADIEITADGRHIYASNRGHNSIAVFAVGEKGRLTALSQAPSGTTPRSFNLSPDNAWLVAAGQKSDDLHVYRRDTETGELTKLEQYPTGKNPSWVQFLPQH